jgi:4'-phosphopantetheinyl transferase
MEEADYSGRDGFAASLSMSQAASGAAWAIAVKCVAPHEEPRARWLPHPDFAPLKQGLSSGEIVIWLAAVSPPLKGVASGSTALVLEHAATVLDRHENDRLARLVHDDDRRSYLAAHAGARLMLGRTLDRSPDELRFSSITNHKPTLLANTEQIDFSLSHARGIVAVAVARMPIGVDVEPLHEIEHLNSMCDLVLAAEEQAILRKTPGEFRSRLFLRYWTLKEALLKAAGLGFAVSPNTIVIDAGPAPAVLAVPAALGSAAQWRLIAPIDLKQ